MRKIIVFLMMSLIVLSVVSAEGLDFKKCVEKCVSTGRTNCPAICKRLDIKEDVRDRKEDIWDKKEDVRDRKEDIWDASQKDFKACVEKCKEDEKPNCAAACKKRDIKEDVRDRKEDIKDKREDKWDKKEDILDRRKNILIAAKEKCDNTNNPELCKRRIEERAKNIDKLPEKARERLDKIEERRSNKNKELKDFKKDPKLKKYDEDNDYKARKIGKEKLDKAKKDYTKTKEKYIQAKEKYNEKKKNFNDKKEELRKCKGVDPTKCDDLEEEIRDEAKKFLINTADRILKHLDKVRAKVDSNEDLSEDEVTEILANIDEMATDVESAKSTIEASEDKEEIQAAARTIKGVWTKIKHKLAIHTGKIVSSKIGYTIMKMKNVETSLERTLARMEENGIDTTEIQSSIDDINELVGQAKSDYSAALDKFKEAAEAEDAETAKALVQEGNELIKAVHNSLIEARKILSDVIKMIREAGGAGELIAPEDEIIEEVEEEEEVDSEETDDSTEEETDSDTETDDSTEEETDSDTETDDSTEEETEDNEETDDDLPDEPTTP